MYGMYVGWGRETYLEKKRYVCMYAWSKRTYLKSRGIYVCRRHRRVVHTHHVCMSGETYIPCMYVCMYVGMCVCMSGETYIPSKLQVCMVCMYVWVHVQHRRVCGQRVQVVFMYVKGMYIWGHIHTYIPIVSPDIHTYLSFSRSVCFLHTSFAEVSKYLAGNPCLPPHLGMYVCMYVETYRRSNYGYVCMSGCESGETYIPRTL